MRLSDIDKILELRDDLQKCRCMLVDLRNLLDHERTRVSVEICIPQFSSRRCFPAGWEKKVAEIAIKAFEEEELGLLAELSNLGVEDIGHIADAA